MNSKSLSFKSDYASEKAVRFDFTLSDNPLGCSRELSFSPARLRRAVEKYPSPRNKPLRRALAEVHNVREDQIYVAAGAASALQDICRILLQSSSQVVMSTPSFPGARIGAALYGSGTKLVPLDCSKMVDFDGIAAAAKAGKTGFIFIANPNNPTGIAENVNSIFRLCDVVSCPVVVSEASAEYLAHNCLSKTGERPANLVVVRSLSKAYGLSGARVGYVVGSSEFISILEETSPPFRICAVAEHLAVQALAHPEHIQATRVYVARERKVLTEFLQKHGFTVHRSDCNILFGSIPDFIDSVETLNDELSAYQCRILPAQVFGCSSRDFRIALRGAEENRELMRALRAISSQFSD